MKNLIVLGGRLVVWEGTGRRGAAILGFVLIYQHADLRSF